MLDCGSVTVMEHPPGTRRQTHTKSVKFKKKFAYSIAQPAIACAEHYSGPDGACQRSHGPV